MLWIDRRFVPDAFAMGRGLKLAVWVSAILLLGFGASAIVDYTVGLGG